KLFNVAWAVVALASTLVLFGFTAAGVRVHPTIADPVRNFLGEALAQSHWTSHSGEWLFAAASVESKNGTWALCVPLATLLVGVALPLWAARRQDALSVSNKKT